MGGYTAEPLQQIQRNPLALQEPAQLPTVGRPSAVGFW
jgi:hypothetical protein